jgi:hypothetical protein
MTAVGMTWDGQPIVAIAFATDRTPYAVRNPAYGTVGGHNIEWEVPMRAGTAVRTATRNELLSILSPALKLPRHELIAAGAALQKPTRKEFTEQRREGYVQRCTLTARFYLIAQGSETITLDANECEVLVAIPGFYEFAPLGVPKLDPADTRT